MEEDLQRLIANNEATFRDVNEALKRGRWPGEEDVPAAFRCECARLGCTRMIDLTVRDYDRIRAHPRRFLVAPDHQLLRAETIVETGETFFVVEKRNEAGRMAEVTDPRS